jgi:mannosyltransferase OCH1-like enzyme
MMGIPHIFHYVWLGQSPMDPVMTEWQRGWSRLHPGWQTRTWREDADLPAHMLTCEDEIVECRYPTLLASCSTPARKSDIWRYQILEQQGGVYLDTDVEPIKPIEHLIEGADAFAGLCWTSYRWKDRGDPSLEVGCSIMGAAAHHPWLRELIELTPWQDPRSPISLAFPYLTEITGRHPEVRLLKPDVCYPIPWHRYAQEDRDLLDHEALPEASHAVHRWGSTWAAGARR